MGDDLILRVTTKLVVPPIMLFALYVQFHGDYGAGGGFQAGVIFASAMILYSLIFDLTAARRMLPPWVVILFMPVGVLLYAGVGVASLFLGGQFLDYDVLMHDPLHGQHLGILLIELGVGITVAAVLTATFLAFLGHAEDDQAEDSV